MTEKTQSMVQCVLTGEMVEENKAISFSQKEGEDEQYVSGLAVLQLVEGSALMSTIMERLALNDAAFAEIASIRKQAIAKQQGIQEGANKAVEAVQKAASELGLETETVQNLLSTAFPQPEAQPSVEETPSQEAAQ